jgi:hypothetical protein
LSPELQGQDQLDVTLPNSENETVQRIHDPALPAKPVR